MNTFEDLLAELARERVEFVVVGGLAVAMAGYPRTTNHLDILVAVNKTNLERLLTVLARFGEGAATELSPDDFTMEEGCIRVSEIFDVDLFTQMSGFTYSDLLPQTGEASVAGQTVRHLNAHGLLRLKEQSLRPKDQHDVQVLREILTRSESQ
jgi:hypothetical protein